METSIGSNERLAVPISLSRSLSLYAVDTVSKMKRLFGPNTVKTIQLPDRQAPINGHQACFPVTTKHEYH